MEETQDILAVIQRAAEQTNPQLAERIAQGGAETRLFGRGVDALNSLDFVDLIATIEEIIENDLGISLIIADERAMSQTHSPFRSVQTLADYIQTLITEAKGG